MGNTVYREGKCTIPKTGNSKILHTEYWDFSSRLFLIRPQHVNSQVFNLKQKDFSEMRNLKPINKRPKGSADWSLWLTTHSSNYSEIPIRFFIITSSSKIWIDIRDNQTHDKYFKKKNNFEESKAMQKEESLKKKTKPTKPESMILYQIK